MKIDFMMQMCLLIVQQKRMNSERNDHISDVINHYIRRQAQKHHYHHQLEDNCEDIEADQTTINPSHNDEQQFNFGKRIHSNLPFYYNQNSAKKVQLSNMTLEEKHQKYAFLQSIHKNNRPQHFLRDKHNFRKTSVKERGITLKPAYLTKRSIFQTIRVNPQRTNSINEYTYHPEYQINGKSGPIFSLPTDRPVNSRKGTTLQNFYSSTFRNDRKDRNKLEFRINSSAIQVYSHKKHSFSKNKSKNQDFYNTAYQ